MRLIPSILIALFTTHCGVEAGNAGKGRTGQVKIHFTQESSTGSESLNVAVGSLGLLNSDDKEVATLSPSASTFDLYGSTSSESVLVAESNAIPAGSYAKIAIRLSGEKPIQYRDESGKSYEVGVDEETKESLFIAQDIEVLVGETTTIIVNLDPYSSLARSESQSSYTFNPRGQVSRQSSSYRYEGSTQMANANWACLYAFSVTEDKAPLGPFGRILSRGDDDEEDDDKAKSGFWRGWGLLRNSGGRRGREVEGRPKVSSKSELIKDESSDCDRAFAKAPIKNGKFEFRHLSEGTYSLRVFSKTGAYQDGSEDITIKDDE